LTDGPASAEAPRWQAGTSWSSDFVRQLILQVDAHRQWLEVAKLARQPSGLGWLPDGRRLAVSKLDEKVAPWPFC
jgi:hypothetical protein